MKVDLSQYDKKNHAYGTGIGASMLKQSLWFFCSVLFIRNPFIPFSNLRRMILVFFGAQVGKGCRIKPGVQIKFPWKLKMGDHVWLGESCWIDNLANVTIGNHVCISQGAMLCTGSHNYHSADFELMIKPIVLEDGAWIAAKAVVCPGVVASSHSMLTAGSVATQNMEAYGIYQGNPAVKIKSRVL